MDITCCFIKEQFFIDNSHFVKMLDPGNATKQSHRTYLCLMVSLNGCHFYIPLRNNLGDEVRAYGRIGHSIPSKSRPKAGLDFRYALIINDDKYIEVPSVRRIPSSQYDKITNDILVIESEFERYLSGFIKVAKKNRIDREPLYRESSLVNFLDYLLT